MNGQLLDQRIPNLGFMILNSNECIDGKFNNQNQDLEQRLSAQCAFDEPEVYPKEISCEKLRRDNMSRCFMDGYTEIHSNDVQISFMRDASVFIHFDGNLKIEHLPVEVHEIFPNLEVITAENCSIREISRKNFKNLHRLRNLNLAGNKIKMISSNTFEGLPLLRFLEFRKFLS